MKSEILSFRPLNWKKAKSNIHLFLYNELINPKVPEYLRTLTLNKLWISSPEEILWDDAIDIDTIIVRLRIITTSEVDKVLSNHYPVVLNINFIYEYIMSLNRDTRESLLSELWVTIDDVKLWKVSFEQIQEKMKDKIKINSTSIWEVSNDIVNHLKDFREYLMKIIDEINNLLPKN